MPFTPEVRLGPDPSTPFRNVSISNGFSCGGGYTTHREGGREGGREKEREGGRKRGREEEREEGGGRREEEGKEG